MSKKTTAFAKRILTVKQMPDSDELFLEFTPEMLKELGWLTGDELRWALSETKGEVSVVNLSKDARDLSLVGA